MSYDSIIESLPKPQNVEEQYLYAIACAVAKVEYTVPFSNPFWRKERILKGIWEIAQQKVIDPTIPSDNTVSSRKIVDGAVTESKIADNAVTTKNITDDSVTSGKLSDSSVIESKIVDGAVTKNKLSSDSVSTDKIIDLAITVAKLSSDVSNLLLGSGRVTTAMLKDLSVTSAKLSADVKLLLLASGHTGIVKQAAITAITEEGDALTSDLLKSKINAIVAALAAAEITG
jgi:hypothetical protein